MQLVPFQGRQGPLPESETVIIRTSFIEMELFPSQLLPETAKELSTVPLGGQAITVGQDSNSGLREVSFPLAGAEAGQDGMFAGGSASSYCKL